jgi:hypothetical protein
MQPVPKIERETAANNSMPGQQGADGTRAHARNHLDKRLRRWADRQHEINVDEGDGKQTQNQKDN